MKTERRHELKTNEVGVFLLEANDWLKENGTKVIGGVIVVIALIFVVNSIQKAGVEKADLASKQLNEAGQKLGGDEWQEGFDELDTLIANAGSRDFKMHALLLKAGNAERLAAGPNEFKEDLISKAEDAYNTLLSEYSGRGLIKARAQLGLAVVCENKFAVDGNMNHKENAKELLTAVSESEAIQGTPLQTLAVARLDELDKIFTRIELPEPPPPPPAPVGPPAQTPDINIKAPEGVEIKKLDGPPPGLLEKIEKAKAEKADADSKDAAESDEPK